MPVTAASDQETADVDTATWTIPALRARSAHLRHLERASQDSYEIGKRDRAIREAYDGGAKVPELARFLKLKRGRHLRDRRHCPLTSPQPAGVGRGYGYRGLVRGPMWGIQCGSGGGPEPRCVDRTHRAGAWFRSTTL